MSAQPKARLITLAEYEASLPHWTMADLAWQMAVDETFKSTCLILGRDVSNESAVKTIAEAYGRLQAMTERLVINTGAVKL